MKKLFLSIFLTMMLVFVVLPAYAENIHVKLDDVNIISDVDPELISNCTMVPLRIMSENLGAKVDWTSNTIILTKKDCQVILKIGNKNVQINGKTILLDVKPYLKDNHTMVPLRFLAETFGCKVSYRDLTVTVDTEPLIIDGVKVGTLLYEYHMTMGGKIQQIKGNAYNNAIYEIIINNKGKQAEAPVSYSWMSDIDTIGAYYKKCQFDFLNTKGDTKQRFDIYGLVGGHSPELLSAYPIVLIHDVTADEWSEFDLNATQTILQIIDTATKNGFVEVISDTIV